MKYSNELSLVQPPLISFWWEKQQWLWSKTALDNLEFMEQTFPYVLHFGNTILWEENRFEDQILTIFRNLYSCPRGISWNCVSLHLLPTLSSIFLKLPCSINRSFYWFVHVTIDVQPWTFTNIVNNFIEIITVD